jgi:GGDEF domain-containing protein
MHQKIVLPPIDRAPAQPELEGLLQSAKDNSAATIELPFTVGADHDFTLSASFAFGSKTTPKWYLFDSDKSGSSLLWTTSTQHLELVQAKVNDLTRTKLTKAKVAARKVELPAPAAFNHAAYAGCLTSITDPESGLFNEGCLFWFISLEYDRFQRFKTPFSLLLLSVNAADGKGAQAQPTLADLSKVVKASIRSIDIACRYQNILALILPHSDAAEASQCAERLAKIIENECFKGAGGNPFSLGVASVPTTCEHPGVLVAAALEASEFARMNDKTVMVFGADA